MYKKKIMRIWSVNEDKLKKSWTEYLLNNPSFESIWMCLYMFNAFIERFINRKLDQEIEHNKKMVK